MAGVRFGDGAPQSIPRRGRSEAGTMDFTENSVEPGAAPRWYVVRTHLKQESRAEFNLKAWNVEVFSPLVKERRVNEFSSVAVAYTAPLFPRYIFARFD